MIDYGVVVDETPKRYGRLLAGRPSRVLSGRPPVTGEVMGLPVRFRTGDRAAATARYLEDVPGPRCGAAGTGNPNRDREGRATGYIESRGRPRRF